MTRYWYNQNQKTVPQNKKWKYRKVSKFWDDITFCCKQPKIRTKRPNLRVFCQNDENGLANCEDLDQTAPAGAV